MVIVATPTISGSGTVTGVFTNPAGDILAIASTFPLLVNPPGRAAYAGQRLRQRLALHRRGEAAPFAVFDAARLPINDVSFHPRDPVIAVGAGSYDGGYLFEGELWLWDWRADRAWQPVKAVPEVERCRFTGDGRQLHVLGRPGDEERGGAERADDPFERLYPAWIAYEAPASANPADIVLDAAAMITRDTMPAAGGSPRSEAIERCLKDWLAVEGLCWRGAVWGVAWLDADRIGAVHDGCLLEVHDVAAGSVRRFREEGRYGAAILRTSPPVVVTHARSRRDGEDTCLLRFTGEALVETARFEGNYTFSSASDGALVGRLDRHRAGRAKADVILSSASAEPRRVDLGHYDCFNHFLGIDGAPDLFILQGTPPSSHENKRLCRVQADGTVRTLWPLLPTDRGHASHAMECLGCHVEDALGPAVILAGRHYDPDPQKGERGFLFRRSVAPRSVQRAGLSGWLPQMTIPADAWRHTTAAVASAMAFLPAEGLIAVAFLDGRLSLLNAVDGTAVVTGEVTLGGFPSVIYAMDGRDERLALGMFDGRIVVVAIDALKAGADDGRIALG